MNVVFFALVTTAIAAPTELASVEGANIQRPSWSPDGSHLSYEANFHEEKRVELWSGDPIIKQFSRVLAGRRGPSSLTTGFTKMSSGGQVVHEISFSPATIGKYVYSASNDALDYDLYISGGSALAPHPAADGGPAWSPNGMHIAFTSARTGEGDLYLIDIQSIEAPPQQLTNIAGSSELYVSWSADGTSLAFVAHTKSGDNIWVLSDLSQQPFRLTAWPGNQIRPTFSPTEKKIAFYANKDDADRFDIYVS
ncbi:MAG: hypothetical protein HN348_24525, partial [Proteobacteria bacterium]|nr:hypothetical protein [Pseudomonadota bacterium]